MQHYIFCIPLLVRLFDFVVSCWNPDEGQVWSCEMGDAVGGAKGRIAAGWLTYVAKTVKPELVLDRKFQILTVGDYGHLAITTNQRFNIGNRHHLARLRVLDRQINE